MPIEKDGSGSGSGRLDDIGINGFDKCESKFHHTSSNLKSSLIEIQDMGSMSLSPERGPVGLKLDTKNRPKSPYRSIVFDFQRSQ